MAEATTSKRRIPPATIALALAGLIALAAIIYSVTRSAEPAASGNQAAAPAQPPADPAQSVEAMRQRLAQDPDNHRGWYLLGFTLQQMGNFGEARQAYQRAMKLEPNNPDYLASLGETILVIGGEGAEREAESLFRRALEFRRDHPAPRYYLAILKDMKGQHREALDELIALLKEAPAGAIWETQVRAAAEKIAEVNKIDIAGRLPPPPAPSPAPAATAATAAIPGPTREQMEAARNIPPSQQDQMVKGMVDRLAARLQQNPRDERGWMMLMRSRVVQNDRDGAGAALRSGLAAFADDAAAQQRLRAAATQLGLPQP
jgi:cytochrome c-type biogenesis protein CcmH